jgi:UDP-N-acetylmuramyl pentapeptide phosphotransferase/UDP-N-acetylglucosamine-1-phosphate transferase
MKSVRCTVSLLLGAIVAAIAVVKFTVVLLAAIAGLVVVAAALVAYLKREQWTKPAYRWARDTSGRRSVTPWTPADKGAS